MSTVVIALSGGVDSSVAAVLLKKSGYKVIGVHMQNWDVEVNEGIVRSEEGCSGKEDLDSVKRICEILDIPLKVYNFVPEYWEEVFEVYLDNLRNNLNTNPDVLCNSKIKFGVLLERVLKDFGNNVKIATGHWARIIEKGSKYYLGVCSNLKKDQTYFLSSLNQYQLSKILFPLSDIVSKEELREIARENGIPVWNKRDSVGICFVGKRNYGDFICNYLEEKQGNLVDVNTGEVLGKHRGTHLYVLHQRSGLFLKGYTEKYYVCGKDVEKNIVFLCKESKLQEHLHTSRSVCRCIHWINEGLNQNDEIFIKTRHSEQFLKSRIVSVADSKVVFSHEKTYITSPGQNIAFYDLTKRICLGSGMYIGDDKSEGFKG